MKATPYQWSFPTFSPPASKPSPLHHDDLSKLLRDTLLQNALLSKDRIYELSRLFDIIAPDTPLDAQLLITGEFNEVTLLDLMQQTYGVPSQPSHTLTALEPQLALIFPDHLAETFNVVPFRSSDSGLIVLSSHPLSQSCVDTIKLRTRLNIQPRLTTSAHVALIQAKLYGTALPYFVSQAKEITAWLNEHQTTHDTLGAEPPSESALHSNDHTSFQEFEEALDRNEILNSLLTEAQSSFAFAALFRVHNKRVFGWRTLDPTRAKELAEVHLSLSEAPLFQTVCQSGKHYIGPPQKTSSYHKMRQTLRLDEATQVLALPITCHEQVSAVLYCEQSVGKISPEWVAPFIDLIRRAQWAMGREPLLPQLNEAPTSLNKLTPTPSNATKEPQHQNEEEAEHHQLPKPLSPPPSEPKHPQETEFDLDLSPTMLPPAQNPDKGAHLSAEALKQLQPEANHVREPELEFDLSIEPIPARNPETHRATELELDLSVEPIMATQTQNPIEKDIELELDLSVEPIMATQTQGPIEKEIELELDLSVEPIMATQTQGPIEKDIELELDLNVEPIMAAQTQEQQDTGSKVDLPMEPVITFDEDVPPSHKEEPAFNLSLEPILAEDLAHELQREIDSELEEDTSANQKGHFPEAPEPPRPPQAAAPTTEELLKRLHSENPTTLSQTVDALVKRGDTVDALAQRQFPGKIAFNPLATNAKTPSFQRCSGLLQYIQARGPSAFSIVRPHLNNRDPIARFFAVYFLNAIHVPEALQLVSRRLYDSEPTIRRLALETLTQHPNHPTYEKIIKGIVRQLRVPIIDVQLSSLQLLAQLRDKRSIPALTPLLSSPHTAVAEAAASSLTLLCAQEFGTDKAQWNQWWEQHHHEPRPTWLVAGLRHPSHAIRDLSNNELSLLAALPIHYNPQATPKRREKATQAWESWWSQQAPAPTSGSDLNA